MSWIRINASRQHSGASRFPGGGDPMMKSLFRTNPPQHHRVIPASMMMLKCPDIDPVPNPPKRSCSAIEPADLRARNPVEVNMLHLAPKPFLIVPGNRQMQRHQHRDGWGVRQVFVVVNSMEVNNV